MKNKVMYALLCFIFVLIVCLSIIGIIYLKNRKVYSNKQLVNISTGIIEDANLINKLELTGGKIRKENDRYYISITATNNTKEEINMNGYKIRLMNTAGSEIEWFNGTAIGKLKANESISFEMECYSDLTNFSYIMYEDMGLSDYYDY